jgi:hypothetical protein
MSRGDVLERENQPRCQLAEWDLSFNDTSLATFCYMAKVARSIVKSGKESSIEAKREKTFKELMASLGIARNINLFPWLCVNK